MSTSFDVFPTNNYIPDCNEIVCTAVELFSDFLRRENIEMNLSISVHEMSKGKTVQENPCKLISYEDGYDCFSLNQDGNIFVYYYEDDDIVKEFWQEEMTNNPKAKDMKVPIEDSLRIGHYWNIVRTAGQPVSVSLFYGYMAIALAKLTDGIIYSDDGAWEYSCFPIKAEDFGKIYFDIKCITDAKKKADIENWIHLMKNG